MVLSHSLFTKIVIFIQSENDFEFSIVDKKVKYVSGRALLSFDLDGNVCAPNFYRVTYRQQEIFKNLISEKWEQHLKEQHKRAITDDELFLVLKQEKSNVFWKNMNFFK